MNVTPNFFVVGGPKCGTTAMVEFLRTHPDIFISEPKEPNFLADNMPAMKFVDSLRDYLNLFKKAKDFKIIGDASIFYMFSQIAIKNIYDLNPNSKLLVMLRNPLEMVPSYHQQILFTLDEDCEELELALNLEKRRKEGELIPKKCRESKLLNYSEIAKYGNQLDNIFRYFPKENVKILLFDDFKLDNKKSYLEVLGFLNLEDDGRSVFPRINDAKKAKSNFLNKIVNRPPKFAKYLAKIARKALNQPRLGILNKLDHLNRAKLNKSPITKKERLILKELYLKDILKTEKHINKNLKHWTN